VTPDDLRYTAEHEWVRIGGGGDAGTDADADADADAAADADADVATIGITDYAQEALGDIVYVSLPEVGETLAPGASVGELESTKSVSDIYAPLAGTVEARNEALDQTPELVNSDPYGAGWLLRVRLDDPAAVDGLLDAAAYSAQIAG
jgi:glycine cleavage system H protein